jgi:hypothetical protein
MNERSASRPANARTFLLWIGGTMAALLLLLGLVNYFLNPLTFRTGAMREVAEVLQRGQNFALDDANIDFRGLRREQVRLLTARPDVVLFAGSRFEVASANTFPGQSFLNTFGHNDYFEDLLAVTALLEEADKLPKTLVLSVRHLSFKPIRERETDEWRMFSGEYQRMAQKLDIPVVGLQQRFPFGHYLSMFSIEYLKHGIAGATMKASLPYGATSHGSAVDREILHADGSLTFSGQHMGTFSPEAARTAAVGEARKLAQRKATLPTDEDAKSLEKLLRYLQSRNVQTVVAITPHHPAFWQAVANEPYGRTLTQLEVMTREIVQKTGGVFVGSFDPKVAGCKESSFRDYIHLDEVCLKTIFDQIPRRAPAP